MIYPFISRYVRCLGAFYLRLTGTAIDCYNYLEPLYNDYRKVYLGFIIHVKKFNRRLEHTHNGYSTFCFFMITISCHTAQLKQYSFQIKVKNRTGVFELSHIDEYIESLLTEEIWCGQSLPRVQKRSI